MNAAAGIGGNTTNLGTASFNNNRFTLSDSAISSSAHHSKR